MNRRVYIFGAHSRARTLAVYLTALEPSLKVVAFLYDNDEENPEYIDSVPVVYLPAATGLETDCSVYLGIRGVNHEKVTESLKRAGFKEIIPVTPEFDTGIRTRYLKKIYAESGREFVKIDDLNVTYDADAKACIYEVRSVYDKTLEAGVYNRAEYERSIQVGAALTDKRLLECEFYDNEGDNISEYNRQLCEETALYWIWKHVEDDISGLVHYRRHFILPQDWKQRMVNNGVDVVLPIPLYVGPSIAENYRFRHVAADWDLLLEVLKGVGGWVTDRAETVFMGNLYFPCNMFIMRREVLQDYCSWLFPILFKVMERVGEHDDAYQNRYPAFMAERLLTLFFVMHKDRYSIIYADKNFLG